MTVYTWTGSQLLWLALRSVFFHLFDDIDDVPHTVPLAKAGGEAPLDVPKRMSGLIIDVSRYQMLRHTRGPYCYENDARSMVEIKDIMAGSKLTYLIPLAALGAPAQKTVGVEIVAIIGDTLLSVRPDSTALRTSPDRNYSVAAWSRLWSTKNGF